MLAGKRCFEISIGEFDVYIQELSAGTLAEISAECSVTLQPDQLAPLIDDYQQGLSFILLEVR